MLGHILVVNMLAVTKILGPKKQEVGNHKKHISSRQLRIGFWLLIPGVEFCSQTNDTYHQLEQCSEKSTGFDSESCSAMSHSVTALWTVAHQAPLSMEFFRQEC